MVHVYETKSKVVVLGTTTLHFPKLPIVNLFIRLEHQVTFKGLISSMYFLFPRHPNFSSVGPFKLEDNIFSRVRYK